MKQIRFTVSMDEGIYKLIKGKTSNMSRYIEDLVRDDLFKQHEGSFYDVMVRRLKEDGYIHEPIANASHTASHDATEHVVPIEEWA